jgi:hypothetical protein
VNGRPANGQPANRWARRIGLLAALALLPLAAAAEPAPRPRPAPLDAAAIDAEVDPAAAADLFARPEAAADIRLALAAAEAGDLAGAAARLDRRLARHPGLAELQAARAAVAMLAGDGPAALAGLEAAARLGLTGLAADPLFAPLAADPALGPGLAGLAGLAAAPPAPPPAVPAPAPVALGAAGGTARVGAGNTGWNPATERLEPRFGFPPAPVAPVLPDRPKTAALEILREHAARGRAAGNHGDLYDNRDRGHSALDLRAHPQLAAVAYGPAARRAELDYGLNDRLLFDRPTIGNSSTAVTGGAFWRSLPRLAMTRADGTGPLRLWQNAAANHLYVFPAHRDWTAETGDLFPANTPYLLVSRGASGSDRPFLEALALILAAFRPETKARLVAEGLVVPTVQMVFRRSLRNVTSRAAYTSGAAHPAAFEAWQINPARMVSLANAIAPEAIPAEVRLAVVEEELGTEGVDFFGEGLSEQLFDTPGAIARIWRAKAWRRSMIVSAEASRDPNGRPLAFTWALLQGDPARVRIEPLGDGARARITVDWHEPFRISEENPVTTSRVDIGVFASNGVHDSAPAILSWLFPPEARRWEPGPDGTPRIAAIDHADPGRAKTYADPLLFPRADWRDEFAYAADGRPAGWTRHRPDRTERFTAEGLRIVAPEAAAADAGPSRLVPVEHRLVRAAGGRLEIRAADAF